MFDFRLRLLNSEARVIQWVGLVRRPVFRNLLYNLFGIIAARQCAFSESPIVFRLA